MIPRKALWIGLLLLAPIFSVPLWAQDEPQDQLLQTEKALDANAVDAKAVDAVEAEKSDDLMEMSLEDLMKVEITVASYAPKAIREQPGIVTVITRKDIESCGARDLIDIINLVPGFRTVSEVHEVISLGCRGIYAAEGKILLLIDGIEMNENLYGYFILGEHYPAEMIEQIEIIRGPGSAMYGGNAEMAVIKITTRGQKASGTILSSTVSVNSGHATYRNSILNSHNEDKWGYSIYASGFRGNRSNEEYKTIYGYTYKMEDESRVTPEFYNVGVRYDKLKLRAIHDAYDYYYKDSYGDINGRRRAIFDTTAFSGEYEFAISDQLKITPKIIFRRHNPWSYEINGVTTTDRVGERITYNILSQYQIDEKSLLSLGVEYYEDVSCINGDDGPTYRNKSYFAQYEVTTPLGDISLGGRYEDHSYAGTDFVPRFALTKVYDKFHYKLLAAQAFRTPNILNVGTGITSEKTTTYEGEVGYQFSDSILWTVNAFHLTIEDPLYWNGSAGNYINASPVASYGLESELRYVPSWGDVKIRYGWYQTDRAGVPLWRSDDENQAAAFPNHQISVDLTYNLPKDSSINLNGFITSDYESYKISHGLPTEHFNSSPIFNIYYMKKIDNIKLGLGISDLFNERETISSYNSYQAPVPQMGRAFYFTFALEV